MVLQGNTLVKPNFDLSICYLLQVLQFAMDPTPEPKAELNLDSTTWEGWLNQLVVWTAHNPLEFLYYVLLGLSPFIVLSLVLSWKLAKTLEKENKKKAKRESTATKARKMKSS